MNSITHMEMSIVICKAVERETGVKLDIASFIYGSAKPDFSPALLKLPHVKNDGTTHVRNQIFELVQSGKEKFFSNVKQFSEKLGIITHYLSDFFCFAHTENFSTKKLAHIKYETMLIHYYRKNSMMFRKHVVSTPVTCRDNLNSLYDLIESLHNQYLLHPPSYLLDISFALTVCISVNTSILKICMQQGMQAVA